MCTHREDSCINRNTNSWTTNSSEACGLRTHFYTGHMGDAVPAVFYCDSQLMLNNMATAPAECGLSLEDECADCNANYKACTCGYTAETCSYRACRACKTHESPEVKSACFKSTDRLKKDNLLLTFLFASHFLCARILTFCFAAPSYSLIKWNVSVVGFTNKIQEL